MNHCYICFLFILSFSNRLSSQPCNYSGLKDKSLFRRVSSPTEYLKMIESQMPGKTVDEGGLPDFHTDVVTGRKVKFSYDKGGIEAVHIECDSKAELKATVYYTGLKSGYIELLTTDARHQPISSILPVIAKISSNGACPVSIKIDSLAKDGLFFQSSYLKVTYFETKNTLKGKSVWFDMSKRWRKEIAKEKIIIPLSNIKSNQIDAKKRINWNAIPKKNEVYISNPPGCYNCIATARWESYPLNYAKAPLNLASELNFSEEINKNFNIKLDYLFKLDSAENIFYYLPKKYVLKYNPKATPPFNMKINYGTAKLPEDAIVKYSLALDPMITTDEEEMVLSLLKKYFKQDDLTLLPYMPSNAPELSLRVNDLVTIPSSNISLDQSGKNVKETIIANFNCDQSANDDILAMMETGNIINGTASYQTSIKKIDVPIEVAVNLKDGFGRLELNKNNLQNEEINFRNPLPYPIKIHKLLYLGIDKKDLQIYDVNSPTIPSQATIKFSNPEVILKLKSGDNVVDKFIFDYTIEPCKECFDELISDISFGTSESRIKNIRFEILYNDFYDLYKVKSMQLVVKSSAADPKRKVAKEIITDLKENESSKSIGPFYAIKDQDVNYQYRYILRTEDKTYQTNWMAQRGLELYLQKSTFNDAFAPTGLLKTIKTINQQNEN